MTQNGNTLTATSCTKITIPLENIIICYKLIHILQSRRVPLSVPNQFHVKNGNLSVDNTIIYKNKTHLGQSVVILGHKSTVVSQLNSHTEYHPRLPTSVPGIDHRKCHMEIAATALKTSLAWLGGGGGWVDGWKSVCNEVVVTTAAATHCENKPPFTFV